MNSCEQCGADLAAGEPHRTDQGQHDITGSGGVTMPPMGTRDEQ
jgi:hypothetical protein